MSFKHWYVVILIITVVTAGLVTEAKIRHDSRIYNEQSQCVMDYIHMGIERADIVTFVVDDTGMCAAYPQN